MMKIRNKKTGATIVASDIMECSDYFALFSNREISAIFYKVDGWEEVASSEMENTTNDLITKGGQIMREIKFRGKTTSNKWVFGQLIKELGSEEYVIMECLEWIDGHEWCGEVPHSIQQETIGQYTGLKDKNGVEIYEGDILRLNKKYVAYSNGGCIPDQDNICVGYVVFDDNFSGWCVHVVESENEMVIEVGDVVPIYAFDYDSGYEVIGNIYDNQELLRDEDKKQI